MLGTQLSALITHVIRAGDAVLGSARTGLPGMFPYSSPLRKAGVTLTLPSQAQRSRNATVRGQSH